MKRTAISILAMIGFVLMQPAAAFASHHSNISY